MRNQLLMVCGLCVVVVRITSAQSKVTQTEIDRWKADPASAVLESSPCKKITWLLESESVAGAEVARRPIRYALGWWGRGFVEGAVYVLGEKAQKSADDFGLSVDVVASHLATYCTDHPADTPADAIQHLLLKVLK